MDTEEDDLHESIDCYEKEYGKYFKGDRYYGLDDLRGILPEYSQKMEKWGRLLARCKCKDCSQQDSVPSCCESRECGVFRNKCKLGHFIRNLNIESLYYEDFICYDHAAFQELISTMDSFHDSLLEDFSIFHRECALSIDNAFDYMFESLCGAEDIYFGNLAAYYEDWEIDWKETRFDTKKEKMETRLRHDRRFQLLKRLEEQYRETQPDTYRKRATFSEALFKVGIRGVQLETLDSLSFEEFHSLPRFSFNDDTSSEDRHAAINYLFHYHRRVLEVKRKVADPTTFTTNVNGEVVQLPHIEIATPNFDNTPTVDLKTTGSNLCGRAKGRKKKGNGKKIQQNPKLSGEDFSLEELDNVIKEVEEDAKRQGGSSDLKALDEMNVEVGGGNDTRKEETRNKKGKGKKQKKKRSRQDLLIGHSFVIDSDEKLAECRDVVIDYMSHKEVCKLFVQRDDIQPTMLMFLACLAQPSKKRVVPGDSLANIILEAIQNCKEATDDSIAATLSWKHFYKSQTFYELVGAHYFTTSTSDSVQDVVKTLKTLLHIATTDVTRLGVNLTDGEICAAMRRTLPLYSFNGDLLLAFVDHFCSKVDASYTATAASVCYSEWLEDSIVAIQFGEQITDDELKHRSEADILDRVAIHEAGHAVAVVYLLRHCEYLSMASIEPREDSLGLVSHRQTEWLSEYKKKHHGKYAIMCFAGRVAEIVCYNEVELFAQVANHCSCSSDMSHARESLRREANVRYLGSREGVIDKMVNTAMRKTFRKTLKFIKKHREEVIKVANILRNNSRVHGAAIYKLLRVRTPTVKLVDKCFQFDDNDEDLVGDTNDVIFEGESEEGEISDIAESSATLEASNIAELEEMSPGISNLPISIKLPTSVSKLQREINSIFK